VLKWLRSFFYSDDPDVKLAEGMSEYDAAQYREILANNGIMSMAKNVNALYGNYGGIATLGNDYTLWVRESDVEAACQVLGHLATRFLTPEARAVRRRLRQREAG
jgi:hypothetical protein